MSAVPRTLIRNARLFESDRARFVPGTTVVIEGERIVEVTTEPREAPGACVIDAAGRALLPGLIDAHVHVVAASHDLVLHQGSLELQEQPQTIEPQGVRHQQFRVKARLGEAALGQEIAREREHLARRARQRRGRAGTAIRRADRHGSVGIERDA